MNEDKDPTDVQPLMEEAGNKVTYISTQVQTHDVASSTDDMQDISNQDGGGEGESVVYVPVDQLEVHDIKTEPCSLSYQIVVAQAQLDHLQSKDPRMSAKKEISAERAERARYPCDQCNYAATTNSYLQKHKKVRHEGIRFPYTQANCYSIVNFNGTGSIQNKKLRQCDQCNFVATKASSLKHHRRSKHEGIVFPCDKCPYEASTSSNLTKHKMSKHEGVRYPCSECSYAATLPSDLVKHVRNKHDGVKHACKHCDFQSTTTSSLRQHIRYKHEGVRFQCDRCDYAATTSSNLTKHKLSSNCILRNADKDMKERYMSGFMPTAIPTAVVVTPEIHTTTSISVDSDTSESKKGASSPTIGSSSPTIFLPFSSAGGGSDPKSPETSPGTLDDSGGHMISDTSQVSREAAASPAPSFSQPNRGVSPSFSQPNRGVSPSFSQPNRGVPDCGDEVVATGTGGHHVITPPLRQNAGGHNVITPAVSRHTPGGHEVINPATRHMASGHLISPARSIAAGGHHDVLSFTRNVPAHSSSGQMNGSLLTEAGPSGGMMTAPLAARTIPGVQTPQQPVVHDQMILIREPSSYITIGNSELAAANSQDISLATSVSMAGREMTAGQGGGGSNRTAMASMTTSNRTAMASMTTSTGNVINLVTTTAALPKTSATSHNSTVI